MFRTPRLCRFHYPTGPADLAARISKHIVSAKPSTSDVLDALKACKDLGVKPTPVLEAESVKLDNNLLKKTFLLEFPSATVLDIIALYYKRNPTSPIPYECALIPFRKSLYDADLKAALKITDATVGHANYVANKNQQFRRGCLQIAATAIGVTVFSKLGINEIVEMGWLAPGWRHLGAINAMVLTYILNLSFFVAIVRFGRQLLSAGGDFLTWQKGTFYTHWFRHSDEMSFCARIMETDFKLNGGLENLPQLVEELCRVDERQNNQPTLKPSTTRDGGKVRLLAPKDNLEQLKMQAYWMSGGDGFEWAEPDQDPAEIVWRRHLASKEAPGVTGLDARALKWADDLCK